MNNTDFGVGDIVELRSRLWRVDSIVDDILTATNIEGGEVKQRRFYLPFEGAKKAQIISPDSRKLGDPASNRVLIQAIQYSMLHGAAPLLSMQKSSVIPTNYQLVPVVMALNMSNHVRMLIADDVGLGKTIEAGLIATELASRNLASRILVVCPKNLREQWREALEYFFQFDARIISSIHRRYLEKQLPPGANPWEYYHCLITSIDYAKSDQVKHQVYEVPWDLVIVDEAHLAAKPHQTGEKDNISMDRYNFVKELSKKTNHLLLLTATPHNGYTDSYASLLSFLDSSLISGPPNDPVINRGQAKYHICQRRRKDVEEWFKAHADEENPFPTRKQREILIDLVYDEEKQALDALGGYGTAILSSAEGGSHKTMTTAKWTVMHLHKRALSSPAALRQSLKNRHERIMDKISKAIQDEEVSITPQQVKANALDDDFGDDITDEEASYRVDRNVFGSIDALKVELQQLDGLLAIANSITPAKDSKLRKLTKEVLNDSLRGFFGPAKIIIFTRFKDTLDYLEKEIPKRLPSSMSNVEIVTVYGDLNDAQRNERLYRFQQLEKGILIATDCISEGVNLQHMANQIIHYELPWNPNRLEQRNGRIDRYGQKVPEVHIVTLVMRDTLDATILKVLVEKSRRIREEYGFSPPFFGDDTNVIDIIREQGLLLTPSQRTLFDFGESPEHDSIDPFDKSVIDKIKADSFYGQSEIELSEVRQRIVDTEARIGSREDFRLFILSGLKSLGCRVEENHDLYGTLRIDLCPKLQLPGYRAFIEKATFDPRVALRNTGITQLNSGHPIIRRVIELVRESLFDGNGAGYGRTAAITTSSVGKVTLLYYFLARFTVHSKPVTVIEEIIPVSCDLMGNYILNDEEILNLVNAKATTSTRTPEEIKPHIEKALKLETYQKARDTCIARRREEIIVERKSLQKKLANNDPKWLNGIEDVTFASSDLLSITVYYPSSPGGIVQ